MKLRQRKHRWWTRDEHRAAFVRAIRTMCTTPDRNWFSLNA